MENNFAEREINLWDMFWAVCLKWRSILLWAVIFALLAGGFGYYKSAKVAEQSGVTSQVTAEDLRNNLTYEELQAVNTYLEYVQIYEEMCNYNEYSPLMQMNSNSFFEGEISYYVENGYVVEYPVIEGNNNIVAMVEAYNAVVQTEEFAKQIKNVIADENVKPYAMELIDNTETSDTDKAAGVFSIYVRAQDEDTCMQLKEIVKKAVEDNKANVNSMFGEHEIVLLQDVVYKTNSPELLVEQKESVDRCYACGIGLAPILDKFNNNQKTYINVLNKEQEEGCKESGEAAVSEPKVTPTAKVDVKYLIIGFLGGAFIAFAVWVVVYLFAGKLRLEDDFEKIFKNKLLGSVPSYDANKKKWFAFVDKFFLKIRHFNQRYFEREEALEMIAANIRIAAQKADSKQVMFAGAVCGNEEKKVMEAIAEKLNNDDIELVWSDSVLYNAEALQRMVQIGHLVMIEKAEASLYTEVKKEIEICAQHDINLIGCVIVY
ncbi:MAG: hypothetical protein E7289_01925 [Lachnospiraceae bacterium]|nr:hypothetical protein [Lachnospiraceae bacterium]